MFRYCISWGFKFTQSVVNSTHLSGVGRAPGSSCLVLCLFVCYQNKNYALVVVCRKHTGCARECCNCSCKLPGPRPTEDQPVAIAGHSFHENNQITNQLFNKPISTNKITIQPATGTFTNEQTKPANQLSDQQANH